MEQKPIEHNKHKDAKICQHCQQYTKAFCELNKEFVRRKGTCADWHRRKT